MLATRQALIDVEQHVLLAAVSAYVDVRLAQEVVALRQSNVRLITQELRAAEDRFEVGEITRTDVAIAEARLAGVAVGAGGGRGRPDDRARGLQGCDRGLSGQPCAVAAAAGAAAHAGRGAGRGAHDQHPLIRQAQHLVTIADLQVDLAEASAYRRPTVGSRCVIGRSRGSDSQSLGLTLNQTIYAGGRLSALLRQALAGKDRARAALQQTAVGIVQNVGVAWANLAVSAASIEASDEQIRAAQTAFDGVREEAAAGARTTLDVLDAEQELLDARNARLQAEAQRYVGVYQVLATMGLLTVDHLQLGIPTYDPEAYFDAVKNAPSHSVQGKKLDRILEKIGN